MHTKESYDGQYLFILNAPDLEMDEIIKVLGKEKIEWIMPYMNRSDKLILVKDLNKYKLDIRQRVYVECYPEKKLQRKGDILIDHHNEYMRRRSSLVQVKKLLKKEITTHDLWVEAHDKAGVWGAMQAGAPKQTVKKWIEYGLKENEMKVDFAYWLRLIKKSPEINKLKTVEIKIDKKGNRPKPTLLFQIFDLDNYPRKQNFLVTLFNGREIVKHVFFAEPKISRKLQKKFGGYLFGDPKLGNVSWGINNKDWQVPGKEGVLKIING